MKDPFRLGLAGHDPCHEHRDVVGLSAAVAEAVHGRRAREGAVEVPMRRLSRPFKSPLKDFNMSSKYIF